MQIWTDYKSARYLAAGVPPRAAVEQFSEEEFGHPTAWAWTEPSGYSFRVAVDPEERLFRLRLTGDATLEFVVQVFDKR